MSEHTTPDPNPSGLCMCGCGQKTRLAPRTQREFGWVKGEPSRYILNHHRRSQTPEYIIDPEMGCWNWQRYKDPLGYGHLKRNRRSVPAHRFIYERHLGPVPSGMDLDHLCRNPSCCNPAHLEVVTHAENVRRGDRAKLSLATAATIRSRYAAGGVSQSALAAEYGCHQTAISAVIRGKTWV